MEVRRFERAHRFRPQLLVALLCAVICLSSTTVVIWDRFEGTGIDPHAAAQRGDRDVRLQAVHALSRRVAQDLSALLAVENDHELDDDIRDQARIALERARRHLER